MAKPDANLRGSPNIQAASAPRRVLTRLVPVAALHLGLFEAIQQFTVHRRESTGELCLMALSALTFLALAWAAFPLFAGSRFKLFKPILSGAAALPWCAALWAGDYFYSWHARPNLGLYEEPEWVQQHPGFQRQLRQRIEANRWRAGQE
jgi:hypothetical protein